jgi:hypothetical protein
MVSGSIVRRKLMLMQAAEKDILKIRAIETTECGKIPHSPSPTVICGSRRIRKTVFSIICKT